MSDRLVKGIKEAEKELEKQKLKKLEEEVHVQNVILYSLPILYIGTYVRTILQYVLYMYPMPHCVLYVLYVKLHYILWSLAWFSPG